MNIFAPQDRTLARLLEQQSERFGDKPLFSCKGVTWSFAQCHDIAARTAGALLSQGLKPGDRVAIMTENRPEFIQFFMGCLWAGIVAVPINVSTRGFQFEHILANSGARVLIVEESLVGALSGISKAGIPLEQVWMVGEGRLPSCEWMTRRAPEMANAVEPHAAGPGVTATLLYTSGTTGLSKGVCCPHGQLYWYGHYLGSNLELSDADTFLTGLPLFHMNALATFYQALIFGATMIVGKRFSASGFWQEVVETGATVLSLLGVMGPILLGREPGPNDRAHRVRIALAPGLSREQGDEFSSRFGFPIVEGYGGTETNMVISRRKDDLNFGMMGRVTPGFQVKIVDEFDEEVPDGVPGELLVRADEPYSMFTGYFGMAEATVEAWRNLWFHTGDRAVRNSDGYFKFVDRMKDAIRRRGENISSFEVQHVLLSHPAIQSAAVFPVKSDLNEDEVMASLIFNEGAQVTPEEILDFCTPRMAYFAVPRFLDFVKEFPMTDNGKVQKFKLREQGITPTTWDREAHGYVVKR